MPDHLGPQELLRYRCSYGLFSMQEWGWGNFFSRPKGPCIKKWQELSDTHLSTGTAAIPPPHPHPRIPSRLQQALVPQPAYNAHLNLRPQCHPSGEDTLKSPEPDGPSGAGLW